MLFSLKSACPQILAGLPDTIDTYGIVSGLWTSVFALGAFVGPVAGGFLYDAVTFRWAIFMVRQSHARCSSNYCSKVIIGELMSLATIVGYIICSFFWKSGSEEYESLDSNTDEEEEFTTNL